MEIANLALKGKYGCIKYKLLLLKVPYGSNLWQIVMELSILLFVALNQQVFKGFKYPS
jgi:hypothetical protein